MRVLLGKELMKYFSNNKILPAYFCAFVFLFLGAVNFSFTPEIQVTLILLLLVINVSPLSLILILISILCTSTYAIPDSVLRIESYNYPSIYTKDIIFGLKGIDIISVMLIFFSFKKIPLLKNAKINYNLLLLFMLFFVTIFSTVINVFFGHNDYSYLMFNVRGIILCTAIFFMLLSLSITDKIGVLFFAMTCWILKMIFMILFPTDNVIQRDVFGFTWYIFFAGDEYLSFGVICATIIILSKKVGYEFFSINRKKCFQYCCIALALALISQRKGAIPYFFIVFIMIMLSSLRYKYTWRAFIPFLFVYVSLNMIIFGFIYPVMPEIYKVLFFEYNNLYSSALSSLGYIYNNSPLQFIVGIGVAGLYKIINLSSVSDNVFSFGKEVGEIYRYAIWNLPFDRLLLNSGIIGLFIVFIISFRSFVTRLQPEKFYIIVALVPLFSCYNLNPISVLFFAFALNSLIIK